MFNEGAEFALSSAQEAIWFAQKLESSALQNISAYLDLCAKLDIDRMRQSIRDSLSESDNLLVQIVEHDDRPVQAPQPLGDWIPDYYDCSNADSPVLAADDLVQTFCRTAIESTASRMFRVAVVKVAESRFFIAFAFNHIVIDAGGLAVLLRRISDRYESGSDGRVAGVGDLEATLLADQEYLSSTAYRADQQFWSGYVDRAIGAVRGAEGEEVTSEGCHYETELPADVIDGARSLAARIGVTLPCLLTAVSALMVHQNIGRPRFYVQIPTSNREYAAGDRPNLLANKVPMEIDVSSDEPFGDWLRSLSEEMLTVIEHGRLQIPAIRRVSGLLHESGDFFGPIINVVPFLRPVEVGGPAILKPVTIGPFDYLSITFLASQEAPTVLHLEADARFFDSEDLRFYSAQIRSTLELIARIKDSPVTRDAVLAAGPTRSVVGDEPLRLWQPQLTARPEVVEYRAPVSSDERALAQIFAEVLGADRVGVDDNFFDLGGNSLLATRIVTRIRAVLHVEVPIRTVFVTQTVSLLAARLPSGGGVRTAVQVMERPGLVPLSFAQQRLWFLHQFEGPSATYNMTFALRLRGAVDADALVLAVNDVVARHESLRTVFEDVDGTPAQRVLDAATVSVPVTFLKEFSEASLCDAANYEFDLATEIPLRATLISTSSSAVPGELVLVLVAHHIAGDGWSLVPLLRDLGVAYRSRLSGGVPGWDPLPVQYADYAIWQREFLGDSEDSDSVLAAQLRYWRGELDGLPDQLVLPFDRPRPAVASYRGDAVVFEIPARLRRDLEVLAAGRGATMSVVLQSALAVLLHRLGAGDDIPIGSPIAGRLDEKLGDLVGFFINTWVLRARIDPGMSFADLIAQVREKALAAYENQDVPFERLVEELNPVRSPAHHPLFQVSLALQNNETPELDLPDVDVTMLPVLEQSSRFDLLFHIADDTAREGFGCSLEYATDLFDRSTVQSLVLRFIGILEQFAANPATCVGDASVLVRGEHDRIREWGSGIAPAVPVGTVCTLFESRAADCPEAFAMIADGEYMTYGQLNARSNRLARTLIDLGVGPESVVAVMIPRSMALVVAWLAVLKSGAAYLPIDPAYPSDRMNYILTDSRPVAAVTNRETADKAPASLPQVVIDEIELDDSSRLAGADILDVERRGSVFSTSLAYVIYTSGSTGKPKGVAVNHHNIMNLAAHVWPTGVAGRTLMHSSTAFDASTYEVWSALIGGGTVVIATEPRSDIAEITKLICEHGVSAMFLTTPLLGDFVEHPTFVSGELSALRYLLVGGEVMSPDLFASAVRRYPDLAFANVYGPTETTTFATSTPANFMVGEASVPIGQPLPNMAVRVLDSRLMPVPIGAQGELYIAGAQLARGYRGRSGLTAARFIADPAGGGGRVYRTGDLVRWRADGLLDFIGRIDDQVKIRGFRVEPGEVEAALVAHPEVAQSAVVPREFGVGGYQLVAFVVADAGCSRPADELSADVQGFVSGRLPEFMVPAVVEVVDRLPLTVNGKVDRNALPAVELVSEAEFRAPMTQREVLLAAVFGEVLSVDRVGLDDDFFRMGGHSLLATRLVSRIRVVLGVEVPIRVVFECPTVGLLAARLDDGLEVRGQVRVMDRPDLVPLSFAQQRLWFVHRFEGPSPTYNIAFALRLRGAVDVDALTSSLDDVVGRHESLRTVFAETGGVPGQCVLEVCDVVVPIEIVDGAVESIDSLVSEAASYGFDLSVDIPLRCRLIRLATDDFVLAVVLHHIAGDGWSLVPLLRDLGVAYRSRLSGGVPGWDPLPVQYADYAIWQREFLGDSEDSDSVLAAQLRYWRGELDGLPDQLVLPFDRPRPAVASYRGDAVVFEIPAELRSRLERIVPTSPTETSSVLECRVPRTTTSMVLQGALAVLLHRLGAGDDIPIGSAVAGRLDESVQDLVGFFVNTWVLRARIDPGMSFADLIAQVREKALAAYENQDVPFERLVEELNPVRSPAHHPLFQVSLAFQNNARPTLELPGIDASVAAVAHLASRFDLLFNVADNSVTGGFSCFIEYATDLFDRSTVQLLASRFVGLLDQLTADPSAPLDGVVILVGDEPMRLAEWGTGVAPDVPEASVAQLFEARVVEHSDAVAVIADREQITYRELNSRANQLARVLTGVGIAPESIVAVALPRSIDLVVALLAVLKAGGAYLPIDPAYPSDRIGYIIADADPVVALTDHATAGVISLPESLRRLYVDVLGSGAAANGDLVAADESAEDNLGWLHPDTVANTIYTSGSTGAPKGVALTHRNIVNLATHVWPLAPGQRSLMHSSTAFDASMIELWPALLGGGTVVVATAPRTELSEITKLIAEHQVAAMFLTTPLLGPLTEHPDFLARRLSGLDRIIVGGAALPVEDCRRFNERYPSATLVNGYGPAESTVCATQFAADSVPAGSISVPIGRPATNIGVRVLDRRLQPLPVGVPGELYLVGVQLARGYRGRPGLTASRFVADPLVDGGRMYRTGDVVCWRAGGMLEFVGRADDQVKIRGFRVEPGEVEAALMAHPGVAQAVVVPRKLIGADGGQQLVAFIVGDAERLERDREAERAEVAEWQTFYDELYARQSDNRTATTAPHLGDDFDGWNSSYTGQPIPIEDMREWQKHTVDRILELAPVKVLEVGVGSGLLLAKIAPKCDEYWGTDLSHSTIAELQRALEMATPDWRDKIHLEGRAAHDLSDYPKGYFDTVVLNSVVQYFPSVEYFQDVIAQVFDLLAPGGALFIGDIRNLALHREFLIATQAAKHPDEEVPAKAEEARRREKELMLAPHFFADSDGLGGFEAVDISLKRGRVMNELTRYRYDVTLFKAPEQIRSLGEHAVVEFVDEDSLAELLATSNDSAITVVNIPHAGLRGDLQTVQRILDDDTVANTSCLLPQDCHDLGARFGCRVRVTWAPGTGLMDAVFVRSAGANEEGVLLVDRHTRLELSGSYSNRSMNTLKPNEVRRFVSGRLPEFMVPAVVEVVDRLPLTVNGKVDRNALPAVELVSEAEFRAPMTQREVLLAAVFGEVLSVDRVGLDDDFFRMGGHSLLATRLVSRIRVVLGVEVPIRVVFECPTVGLLAARLDDGLEVRGQVRVMDRPDLVPLSFAQQRLWFVHRFEGPSPTYNIAFALRLRGAVDVDALTSSLDDVVGRHESLRTVFAETGGVPGQCVLEVCDVVVPIEIVDGAVESIDSLVSEAASYGFDLSVDIPLRCRLIRLATDDFVLAVVLHHIAGDGWSLVPLLRDLGVAYRSRLSGGVPGWDPLPVQYADYAIWQREFLGDSEDSDSVLAAQLRYWRGELDGLPDQLVLPFDRPRPAVASYRGDAVVFEIPARLRRDLEVLAAGRGATMSVVLQSALAVLLHRLGAGDDIPIGSPIAGRLDEKLGDLVGFFINTWVLRARIDPGMSFADLIAQVREKALAAYENQDVPFERLVEELNPVRSPAHHPLFQVSLALQNNETPELDLPDVDVTMLPVLEQSSRFDLLFNISDDPASARFTGVVEYAADLFDRTTVEEFAAGYLRLLGELTHDPLLCVGDVSILSASDQMRSRRWGQGAELEVPAMTAADLFEARVARTPDAVAVISGDIRLTYRELDRRVDRLARRLVDIGVESESVVALILPRSVELVVALLAVVKSGGAYLPIDPDYPNDRIEYILADAEPVVALTAGFVGLPDSLPCLNIEGRRLDDEVPVGESAYPDIEHKKSPRGSNLAYVIYTSGSTGTPKGTAGTHELLANRLTWCARQLGDMPVGMTNTAPGFIDSSFHILSLLSRGGQIVVVDADSVRDPRAMIEAMDRYRVTEIMTIPALAAVLASHKFPDSIVLDKWILSGEPVVHTVLDSLRAATSRADVWNFYGSTEVSDVIHANLIAVQGVDLPIGGPVPNTEVQVLDSRLKPVPVGVAGELFIAGAQLGRGYHHQPGLTAARFIADPTGRARRLYRTGDLVRWRHDGLLDFVGRIDNQVKIRGFRVEPGEVEAALMAHPGVLQSVVVPHELSGNRQLVAYVVAHEGFSSVAAELSADVRRFVSGRLPEFMVPAVVEVVDRLPLTVNGKVDRNALPAVELVSEAEFRAPMTQREVLLAAVFGEVLSVDRVGLDDDFFRMGGHSLLATRLVSRIRVVLGVEVPIRVVFECPTVGLLAARLDDGMPETESFLSSTLTIRAEGTGSPVWCIHPAGGVGWPYFGLERHIRDRPIYALQADGLDGSPVAPSFETMVKSYVDRILDVQCAGPYHLLGWSFGGVVAHALAESLRRLGHEVGLLALLDSWPVTRRLADAIEQGRVDEELSAAMWSKYETLRVQEGFDHVLERIGAVSRNNVQLLAGFTPPVYQGDMMLFHAGLDRDGNRQQAELLRGQWDEKVDGRITSEVIACTHDEFDRPLPLAAVGKAVNNELARRWGCP